jgi:hypothetical protein
MTDRVLVFVAAARRALEPARARIGLSPAGAERLMQAAVKARRLHKLPSGSTPNHVLPKRYNFSL